MSPYRDDYASIKNVTIVHIITEDSRFNLELNMRGTTIFAQIYTSSEKEWHDCPHVIMSSPHEYNTHSVKFHSRARKFADEMRQYYNTSDVLRYNETQIDYEDNVFLRLDRLVTK